MLKIKISLEIFHSFLIISLYFLKILSVISQKLSVISQKTLYNLSKSSLHILSFNLSLYSHSIIKIILTHDHLGMNFTFVLVQNVVHPVGLFNPVGFVNPVGLVNVNNCKLSRSTNLALNFPKILNLYNMFQTPSHTYLQVLFCLH